MKKTVPDVRAGMNIDPGNAMGVLGHDTRNERNSLFPNLVGDPVNSYGEQAGIAENDLIITFRRRIALVCGTQRRLPAFSAGKAYRA